MAVRSSPPSAIIGNAEMTGGKNKPFTGGRDSHIDIKKEWCFVSLNGTVKYEHSTEDVRQITHNVANCISKELLCNHEDELHSETVDEIFRYFEEVAEIDASPMIAFLSAWTQQESSRGGSPSDKSTIIALMVDLLIVSPEPDEMHLLWLRILTHFILLSNNLQALLDLKVAPAILGTMSAYRRSAEIQQYGCTALSIFATVMPTPKCKAPLRESAIEVLTESLSNHTDNINVVQVACQLIASLAEVMVHIPSWCLEQEFTAEETEKLCKTAGNILECIKEGVIDRLGDISRRYETTQEIKTSVTKLMACFGCYSSNRSYPADPNKFRPKAFSFPVSGKEKHVSFAQKLEIIASEKREIVPAVRCTSLDISGAMQQHQPQMEKSNNMKQGSLELNKEETNQDQHKQDYHTHPNAVDEEEVHQIEQQEDAEKQEQQQQSHLPNEECKHPSNGKYLTEEERACLIEEAWKFLDEAHSPLEIESNEDDTMRRGMESEVSEETLDGGSQVVAFDSSAIKKDDLLEKERDIDMEQETAHEHQWDCLFTSPCSNRVNNDIKYDIHNTSGEGEGQNSLEITEHTETIDKEEQLQVDSDSTPPHDNRTLEDITDEMSDGVYSYDVQSDPDNYTVYSEFDIMEALVKTGLLNEKEKKPDTTIFPVDDTTFGDGDRDPTFTLNDGNTVHSHHLQAFNNCVVSSEDGNINSPESSSKSEMWNRVPSHYENIEEVAREIGQVSSSQQSRDINPENDFKQASFDSGLTWHANGVFNSPSGTPPQTLAVEETETSLDGYDSDDTVDRLLPTHPERQRSDSHSSSQSCSSCRYCIQPINRPMECQSVGSLNHLCSLQETQSLCELHMGTSRKKTDVVLKTMSSTLDMKGPPPKPTRTWHYQCSHDVRRSMVRVFGPNFDGDGNLNENRQNQPTYAKVQKKHLSPSSSEVSNSIQKSDTASSNASGVVLLTNKTLYKSLEYSHQYEDIANLNVKSNEKNNILSRHLEEDSSEATYEVCTLWVNEKCTEALDTFNHLTQRLPSLYSILPEARDEESRRSASPCNPDNRHDDYPAWANILNVLASDEEKWTLRLSVRVLPIVDRLFQVKDKSVLNAVIDLVQVIIMRYGKDIIKNRNPSLFKTRLRDDCRECFMWLSKLKLRTEFLLMTRREAESLNWDCLLHSSLLDSFSDSLEPFNQ